jgi:urease accessory protein
MITTMALTNTITGMAATNTEARSPAELFLWLSPAFPVGAFAYSHGLEWAVEAGDIADAATLLPWLEDLLAFGGPRTDAILFALAFRATREGDWSGLLSVNELARALGAAAERRLETIAQGGAFVLAARAAWDVEALQRLAEAEGGVAYPIAVAAAASGHSFALETSLEAFSLSQIANLVSAAVRLGSIGQTDGLKVLARLLPHVGALSRKAAQAGVGDLGGAAFRSDLAAMRHETQYSRLFRS